MYLSSSFSVHGTPTTVHVQTPHKHSLRDPCPLRDVLEAFPDQNTLDCHVCDLKLLLCIPRKVVLLTALASITKGSEDPVWLRPSSKTQNSAYLRSSE
uniref:Putative ras log protein family member q n=1 Tax=Ixodes ricinus TaxID=34613 RepID=A0A0K8RDG0_IXORI